MYYIVLLATARSVRACVCVCVCDCVMQCGVCAQLLGLLHIIIICILYGTRIIHAGMRIIKDPRLRNPSIRNAQIESGR